MQNPMHSVNHFTSIRGSISHNFIGDQPQAAGHGRPRCATSFLRQWRPDVRRRFVSPLLGGRGATQIGDQSDGVHAPPGIGITIARIVPPSKSAPQIGRAKRTTDARAAELNESLRRSNKPNKIRLPPPPESYRVGGPPVRLPRDRDPIQYAMWARPAQKTFPHEQSRRPRLACATIHRFLLPAIGVRG